MRISDWSSDVCSSDLVKKRLHQVSESRRDDARGRGRRKRKRPPGGGRSCNGWGEDYSAAASAAALAAARAWALQAQIGRASGREGGGQYVSSWVVAVSIKQKTKSYQAKGREDYYS